MRQKDHMSFDRRRFIKEALRGGQILLGASLLLAGGACTSGSKNENAPEEKPAEGEKPRSCDDLSGLSQTELDKRKNLGYVEQSPLPDQQCQNCNLYLPPAEGQKCGGCSLFQGPVFAEGYCTYWAPQA